MLTLTGEKDKIVTVLPANRVAVYVTVANCSCVHTFVYTIDRYFCSARLLSLEDKIPETVVTPGNEGWIGGRQQRRKSRFGSPKLTEISLISRRGEGILSRKVTVQHWKIYRKIAGGREVQTNSAEKLIERDRGESVLVREARARPCLSRARIFCFCRVLRLARSSCKSEIFSLVN